MTVVRATIPVEVMQAAADHARRHLRYTPDQPAWQVFDRFVQRTLDAGETIACNCKGFALNVVLLIRHDLGVTAREKPATARALRIGYFDTRPGDDTPEDHVAAMAWDGQDWRLVADTMEPYPLALPRLTDVGRRLTAWSDLTNLTLSHPVDSDTKGSPT